MTPPADGAAPRCWSRRRSASPASSCCATPGFEVELGADWEDGELERRIGEFDGHPDPLGHQAHRRPDRAAPNAPGGRPRRRGRGQRGRGRRHPARHRGGQRAAVQRDHGRRAHDGAAHGAGAQRAPGPRLAHRRAPGTGRSYSGVELYEKTLGRARLRAHRPARGPARPRLRHARAGLRRLRGRGALPRAGRGARRQLGRRCTPRRTSSPCTCPRRPRPRTGSTPRPSPR